MIEMKSQNKAEIARGDRFPFGDNWSSFIKMVDKNRLDDAKVSLLKSLGVESLEGMTFLDIGSGSGIFSLAAYNLGATVFSFDFDPISVKCTQELRNKYYPNANDWTIEEGDALDESYMKSLGHFDIVYSWGVLHHTGNMWKGLKNVESLSPNYVFIAIYNDQGLFSKYWHAVKRLYNFNMFLKALMILIHIPYLFGLRWLKGRVQNKVEARGMSLWIDMYDWLGGLPFEVASPEKIIHFFFEKDLICMNLKTCKGRLGCNEYVFVKR